MPRGYLKRKATFVGRKKARGGNSRKAEYHRTPFWKKHDDGYWPGDYSYTKGHSVRRRRWLFDDPIADQWKDYYDDRYYEDMWAEERNSRKEVDLEPSARDACRDSYSDSAGAPLELLSLPTLGSSALLKLSVENDSAVACVDGDEVDSVSLLEGYVDKSYSLCEEKVSNASSSFFLCDDSSHCTNESASFCLIESKREHDENDAITSSSNSSIWDFVENATGIGRSSSPEPEGGGPPPVKSFVRGESDCSVISQLPEPSVVALEDDIQPLNGQKCAICLEDKRSLCRIMQRCCHPSACMDCLRTHYMEHQVEDISNFPLRCFWPGCNRIVRDAQIRRLADSRVEMIFYYSQANRAKVQRKEAQKLRLQEAQRKYLQDLRVHNLKVHQICRECSTKQSVYPGRKDTSVFRCKQCQTDQPIDVISAEEVRALVDLQGDNLVNCPSCAVLICKDGGCDHMTCVCEQEFSFEQAQKQLRRSPQKSRVVTFRVQEGGHPAEALQVGT